MTNHLQEAVSDLVEKGLTVEEVDTLFAAMKNGVLMDPEAGPAVRKRVMSDGELRFRFVEQSEVWLQTWEYSPELLAPVRHFAVQVANLFMEA